MNILLIIKSNFQPGKNPRPIKKSIIHLILNFTTMKKLIFLLFTLAIFVSANQTFGQAVPGDPPQAVNCTNDAAHPIAGVPYDYSAIISPAGGSAYWYATTSTTFMTAGVRPVGIEEIAGGAVVAVGNNYMDNTTGDLSPTTTTITWTTEGLAANTPATPADPPTLFVALQYSAMAAGCANNVKVYPVRPVNAFVVDVMNMTPGATQTPSGYGVVETQCFDSVQSAVWSPTPAPDGGMVYDFGTNYLYYEMVAANFTHAYLPSFQISNLDAVQTADLDWGYTIGTYDHPVTAGATNGIFPSPDSVFTTETNTSAGVSIYVRLTVHNVNFEGIGQLTVNFAVDAQNSAQQDDVDNATCLVNAAFADNINQTLDPRPEVTEVAPNVFLPVN